jgi:UDP-N-acetylglucosamine transferase subunit ALG13
VTGFPDQPFDRLVKAMDSYAKQSKEKIVIQKGTSRLETKAAVSFSFANDNDMDSLFQEATVVVAHAGIGTILDARRSKKKIVLVPRCREFGEHSNDHQFEIARALNNSDGVWVVENVDDLPKAIASAIESHTLPCQSGDKRDRLFAAIGEILSGIQNNLDI